MYCKTNVYYETCFTETLQISYDINSDATIDYFNKSHCFCELLKFQCSNLSIVKFKYF